MAREPRTRQVASQIASILGETRKQPQHQIHLIVLTCGPDQALAWLEEAQNIEAQGGMFTSDGNERRTPGGSYFKLVRQYLTEQGKRDELLAIFRGKKPVPRHSSIAARPGGRGRARPYNHGSDSSRSSRRPEVGQRKPRRRESRHS